MIAYFFLSSFLATYFAHKTQRKFHWLEFEETISVNKSHTDGNRRPLFWPANNDLSVRFFLREISHLRPLLEDMLPEGDGQEYVGGGGLLRYKNPTMFCSAVQVKENNLYYPGHCFLLSILVSGEKKLKKIPAFCIFKCEQCRPPAQSRDLLAFASSALEAITQL